ncbi:TrbC family F-type conjugative pilus assembly protein [uncultured Thiocystis sp.]|uniref:TrbC family F-type conjugative pilus assembly protein n=1 Tax=uncultured Thiocystis sp. TaxID=1202134 RepID=UPI0025CE963E|nr:TrbC family F-type conjugative pilus assembly protein [uncultured Thiocystis sp.]
MSCSKRVRVIWVGASLIGMTGMVLAETSLPEASLRDQTVRLQEEALTLARPAWLEDQSARQATWRARLKADRLPGITRLPAVLGLPPADAAHTAVPTAPTLLVSRALGAAALRDLFAEAAGRPDVRVVFRGVAPGESLTDFIREIHDRIKESLKGRADAELPQVELDPRPFQTPAVALAPTLIVINGQGKELARVTGLSRPDWLLEQVRQGQRGDLGVRGPSVAISEPDLIAELQRRLVGIDWEARRAASLARYWERARFASLPTVETPRERRLDLTVAAQADVDLPDGTRVIHAGERINPLDRMPFRQRLFVFDATDSRQVADVARRGEASRAEGRRPLYLTTRLDRQAGWDGFRAVQATLGEPLYLLTPDVQTRFGIERVPAMVETRDRVFIVAEWPPEG